MAKRVIWSARARNDRKVILEYWIVRNQSKSYSIKLNQLFNNYVKLIARNPKIGRPTDYGLGRLVVVKDYLIIYDISEKTINIITIWDTRQDSEKLNITIR
jgi:toxin YoeB